METPLSNSGESQKFIVNLSGNLKLKNAEELLKKIFTCKMSPLRKSIISIISSWLSLIPSFTIFEQRSGFE